MRLNSIMEQHGLVLFVGGTGLGKSTPLTALIDHHNHSGHIITIEDPVEFVHRHHKGIINVFSEEHRPSCSTISATTCRPSSPSGW